MGKVAAYILPIATYRIPLPRRLGGSINIDTNPGPWNIKEHVLLYIMANGKLRSHIALTQLNSRVSRIVSLNAPCELYFLFLKRTLSTRYSCVKRYCCWGNVLQYQIGFRVCV